MKQLILCGRKIFRNMRLIRISMFQESVASTQTKMSELARQYENESDSGLNIEMSKQMLRDEDRFDLQRYRERIRAKRREEKMKLKAAKEEKASTNDKEEVEESVDNDDISEAESSEGPDMSWLPDPDKIYGKQQDMDEEDNEFSTESENKETDESEENEESEEESTIHR